MELNLSPTDTPCKCPSNELGCSAINKSSDEKFLTGETPNMRTGSTLRWSTQGRTNVKHASNNYAAKLRGRLITTKNEVNKLSPDKVWPNLHRLISALDNNLALATSIVRGRMKVELTGILKEDLSTTSKVASMIIVPAGKREKSTYSGLCKVRRLLTDSTRIATKLHDDVSSRGNSLYSNSHSSRSTTNVSTHWKPSLNCPFFLKPSTLTFKGMTAEYTQSLATALAKQKQLQENPINNISASKEPAHEVNYGTTCKDLNSALQSVNFQPNKSAPKKQVSKTVMSEPEVSGDDKHILTVMAVKIKNRLKRVQSDISRISSSVEAKRLDMLKQSLHTVNQLVEYIIAKPVTTKVTEMLKKKIQSTHTLVSQLCDSCSRNDQVGNRVLSKLKCILDMCQKMAVNLHVQTEVNLKSCSKQSSNDQQKSKPVHSSTTQVAASTTTTIKCQPAIQTTVSTTHVPSTTDVTTDESSSQAMEDSISSTETTHWKPSMNRKFFLKPPTLIYKGMTRENLQSLAVALAADAKTSGINNSHTTDVDMKQSNDINYNDACKDLNDALQSTANKSKMPSKVELDSKVPLTPEEKRQASKRLANKLGLCLIAVQRELSRLSTDAVRPNLDDLKIAVDNASSLATTVQRVMRVEMASLLVEDLEDVFKTAKKQHVPAKKKDQSTSRGLSRAKRLLEVGVRMADALHNQLVVFSIKDSTVSSSRSTTNVNSSSSNANHKVSTATVATACTVTSRTTSVKTVTAEQLAGTTIRATNDTTKQIGNHNKAVKKQTRVSIKNTPRQNGCSSNKQRKINQTQTFQVKSKPKFPKNKLSQLQQMKHNANGCKRQLVRIDNKSKQLMLEHLKVTQSTGPKEKCRRVKFATQLVCVAGNSSIACTRKKIPKSILKKSSNSDSELHKRSIATDVHYLNGVERLITITDDNNCAEPVTTSRIKLGKRSRCSDQSVSVLKQRKFSKN